MSLPFVRSPNFDRRSSPPDMVVLHYTDMASADAALGWLTTTESRVSAHYLVRADGSAVQMVAEADRAWHAGVSHWAGLDGVNDRSIGIELDSPGHRPDAPHYPDVQIEALLGLLAGIRSRWRIRAGRVAAHSDVAPSRKVDPGEAFPWARVASAGHAIKVSAPSTAPPFDRTRFDDALRRAGYGVPAEAGAYADLVRAFHRRHRPDEVAAPADGVSLALAEAFARAVEDDRARMA